MDWPRSTIKPRNTIKRRKELPDYRKFEDGLEEAIQKCLVRRQKPFRQVGVLAMHWQDNDLDIEPLQRELLDLFRDVYHFHTEMLQFPSQCQDNDRVIDMRIEVKDFLCKWADEDALIILMHGEPDFLDIASQIRLQQCCSDDLLEGPTLNWTHHIRTATNPGRILIIVDSDHTPEPAAYDGLELPSASGPNAKAPNNTACGVLTRNLIDELKRRNGAAATVAEIYASIFHKMRTAGLDSSVIHIPQRNRDSIVLEKLGSVRVAHAWTTSSDSSDLRQHALISVSLKTDVHQEKIGHTFNCNRETWHANQDLMYWLGSTAVKVEWASPSFLLISLPIEVWTMVPADELAYGFIGFAERSPEEMDP